MQATLAARALLVDALRYDLIGPMREDEILDQRPTRWYLAGFLVPRGTAAEQITDPTDDEGDAVGLPTDAEDDQGDPATPATRAWFPSSFGLSVLLDADTDRLRAAISWGQYRKLPPLESAAAWQQHRPAAWASRGERKATGRPSMAIVPASGDSTPARMFMSVDLPAPFSPSKALSRPEQTVIPAPASACTPGNALRIPRASSSGGGMRPAGIMAQSPRWRSGLPEG